MNEDLLIKFLLGEINDQETEKVRQWIAESPSNKKEFEQMELIWNTSKNLAVESKIDENVAWERFRNRASEKKVIKMKPGFRSYWLQMAAVLFFIAGSWLIYSLYSKSGETTLTSDLEVKEEILPDGSEVTMNKNTVLTYSSKFGDRARNLKLKKGEVFFKVKRNEAKPFVIQADGVEVRVLGTSFNVKHSDRQTEVIVETGVVRVKLGRDSVELHKHQKVTILGNGKLRVVENTDQLYSYYITKQLVADNTPLWRIVEALNEIYGAEISIEDDNLRNLPLNATFKEDSLENILNVICDTFRLKMVRNGKKITIKQ